MTEPVVSLQGLVWHSLFEMPGVTDALQLLKGNLYMHINAMCNTKIEDLTRDALNACNLFLCGDALKQDIPYYNESGYDLHHQDHKTCPVWIVPCNRY